MFQFDSNPLQLNFNSDILGATPHMEEDINEGVSVAESSSSFSDMVYDYHMNATGTPFTSYNDGLHQLGLDGLPNGSQHYPEASTSAYPVDYTFVNPALYSYSAYNAPESSSSVNSYQTNPPTLTSEREQYIDGQFLNMPYDPPQPSFSAPMDTISPVVADQSIPTNPTAFEQQNLDVQLLPLQYAAAQAPFTDIPALDLIQQPAHNATEAFFGRYDMGGEPAMAMSSMVDRTGSVTYNMGGAAEQASRSLNDFITTYPSTSVVYGVTAPGQAPASVITTTSHTSAHIEDPPSIPIVAPSIPAPKAVKKHTRPRKPKSSLSQTGKHVKASAPGSKLLCRFPGCTVRCYDKKTRERHETTHDENRPFFFCPGMYLPRDKELTSCNCKERGYTREDALTRHLKAVEPHNPCVIEARRLGWSATVSGSTKRLRGHRPVKPVNADVGVDA